MTVTRKQPGRLRRALAAGAVLILPLGAVACGEDDNNDPEIIDEGPGNDDPMLPDDNMTDDGDDGMDGDEDN